MGNVEIMLYVNYADLNSEGYVGIKKKILAQCRAFEEAFGIVYYTMACGPMMYLVKNNKIIDKEFAITVKTRNEAINNWIDEYNIKRTYIRYDQSDIWFVDFLEQLKNKKVRSVLEFPTMPYDGQGPGSMEDKYYRKQLHNYIDCCTTYANFQTVFDIPCITLVNGVDIKDQKEKQCRKKDGTIVLLAVATHAQWHGYERVIQGMHDYYVSGGERNIVFNIVGNGGQIQYYKELVDDYQLYEHAIFHGQLKGTKLDDIYDNSDIAIGSLGFYKINLQSNAPIKLREYCARGIPFVYGYEDISFGENDYFAYRVSNDATPIDIRKVIEFYEKMYDGRALTKDMREYTRMHLTWNKILQPVIDYLK